MGILVPENDTRKMDALGRITLPKSLRNRFNLDEGEIELFTAILDGRQCICLSKPVNKEEELASAIQLLESNGYTVTYDTED